MLSTPSSLPLLYSSESSLVNYRYAAFSASCSNSNSSFGTWRLGKNGKSATCKIKTHAKMAKSEMDADRITAVPADAGNSSSSFLSFLCPLLKLVGGGDPSGERNDMLEIVTSSLSSLARLPWGSKSLLESSRTQSAAENYSTCLQLYEFEACPFCRRVREAMTELDLSVEVYPCPKGSLRHREIVRNIGGKEQFPFLVDSNTGRSMYESGEIVKYLFYQYGHGRKPSFGLLERVYRKTDLFMHDFYRMGPHYSQSRTRDDIMAKSQT
ncbi:uncharacterized protein [Aristolochia californica]|uniref:uncharacterized protein isoform X2 n=1 Tax=Aristolochia californica TaxID=171875 RepID=UPI0035E0C1ED